MTIVLKYPDDPYRGLYPTCTEAFHAGEQRGQDDALRHAISRMSLVSVTYERAGLDSAFLAAEECIKTVMKLRDILHAERKPSRDTHEGKGADTSNITKE